MPSQHTKNLLIVEGEADKAFIREVLQVEPLDINLEIKVATAPEVDSSLTYTNKQAVLQSLNSAIKQLNDGRLHRIGILIDMDFREENSRKPIRPLSKLGSHQIAQTRD